MTLFENALQRHMEVFGRISGLEPHLRSAVDATSAALQRGGKILFCGNGGSAADAQHLAAELVGRFVKDRPALKALALTTDSSALTCIGNDFGYDYVFSRQIEGVSSAGDVLILISTSGNSQNLLLAAQTAKKAGVTTVGFLGRDGGKLAPLVDISIVVPDTETARIQEAHIFLGHTFCALLERALGYGEWAGDDA